ncbi:IS630 family transposase [Planctomycetales bacterium ZRK34]|nr:IS630 family transposase [Planctomycetales bacterium ZRK34]
MPGAAEDEPVAEKKSLIAAEQRRPDIVERRRNFAIARRFVDPGSFVFLDESGVTSNMTRLYGRSPVGERCVDHTPHGHWKTTTLLSAMRLAGVIESATVIYDGPINRVTFEGYVEQYLAPSLRPGDVVVMDNLSAHKSPAVIQTIESAGASVWYLPAYSPDLNPIEKLWSKVKSWLRRVAARTFDAIGQALVEALRRVESTECANYMRACGYEIQIRKTL